MKTIIDYFKKQDNLLGLSAWITTGIMMLIFILVQIFTFTGISDESEELKEKMEVRELIKLSFTPQVPEEIPQMIEIRKVENIKPAKVHAKRINFKPQQASSSIDIKNLIQGFDIKSLIYREARAAKKGGSNRSNLANAGVLTDVSRTGRAVDNFDLAGVIESRSSAFPTGRRSTQGGSNGPRVGTGGSSSVGSGIGTDGTGLALSGKGMSRSTRGSGNGNGGATITIPSGSGGNDVMLDIHALIKWMKAHQGIIPKLVAYDMGHRSGDLSSAISFTINGKNYTLFLSCNEIELLLRICLIENNDFTLLKDNGIREESNFLTVGDVVHDANRIQSIISSRKAPGNKAAAFYKIFWSWWLQQPESRN